MKKYGLGIFAVLVSTFSIASFASPKVVNLVIGDDMRTLNKTKCSLLEITQSESDLSPPVLNEISAGKPSRNGCVAMYPKVGGKYSFRDCTYTGFRVSNQQKASYYQCEIGEATAGWIFRADIGVDDGKSDSQIACKFVCRE